MTGLEIVLFVFLIVAVALLVFTMRFAYRMSLIVIDVEDAVEASLDVLDEHYNSMSKILEKPVFFDSMEVRQVIEDISRSRDAVLWVANSLTKSIDSKAVEEQEEQIGNS